MIMKLAYVHEGKTVLNPSCKSKHKRNELIGAKYLTGLYPKNDDFWFEVLDYLEATYDLDAVEAYYYSLTGYDYTSGRYTSSYSGIARRVVTKNSSAYDEWFYDGFTPRNWKDNTLAYWFWSNLNGGDQYPGVKVYA